VQASSKKRFRPGELAPITGVYLVKHGISHRESHEVVIIRGEQLPACRACKLNVAFEIIRPISHITHDWDFSGPHNLRVMPKREDYKDTRIFRRVNVQWPVTLELLDSANSGVIHGHSVDLGAGGMGVIIRGKLPSRYENALIRIMMDTGEESLAVRAHLRYHAGTRYGFEFVHARSEEKQDIRRLIDTQLRRAADILC